MIKKNFLTIVFCLLVVFSFVTAGRVWGQVDESANESQIGFENDAIYNVPGANLDNTIFRSFRAVSHSGVHELAGSFQDENAQAGAIGNMSSLVAGLYDNKPADTQTYVADLMNSMGIAQPAYAQGLGFASLSPILELWKVFRNIAYIFFVFIFLAIGFAIMFRQNLGTQTAVTVQQALPRIIVALLMVTFSYAIAGLLIDIMYLVMYFLLSIFAASGLVNTNIITVDPGSPDNLLNQNVFGIGWGLISNGFATNGGFVVGQIISESLSDTTGISFFLSSIFATLILFAAVVIAIFKLFFALLKVYFEIVMMIVFAPLILMMGAIQSNAFGNWIKGLAANLAVFPALFVFILVGYMFLNYENITAAQVVPSVNAQGIGEGFDNGGFLPPFIPGRGSAVFVARLMGIAVIMLLAEIPGIMGRFKPKSIFDDLGGMAWKNAMAGKKAGLMMAAAPVNAAVGAGVGYYAGKKLTGTRSGALGGALLGGVGSVFTNAPVKAARSVAGSGIELGSKFAAVQASDRFKQYSEERELEKLRKEKEAREKAAAAARAANQQANPVKPER